MISVRRNLMYKCRVSHPLRGTLSISLSALLVISSAVSLADQKTSDSRNSSNIKVSYFEDSDCRHTIMRYLEWHSIALQLGSEPDEFPHQWLKKRGLLNSESVEEFYTNFVKTEQDIQSFDSVVFSCTGQVYSSNYSGELRVNSTLNTNHKMSRIFKLVGPDAFMVEQATSVNTGTTDTSQPLQQEYLLQLPFLKEYYTQVLDGLRASQPVSLAVNENAVEFKFAWPHGKIMLTKEINRSQILRNGEAENTSITLNFKTKMSDFNDGVRLSSQYAGAPSYGPEYSTEQLLTWDQQWLNGCLDNLNDYCWVRTFPWFPYHYSINQYGKISEAIIDEEYMFEFEMWMQDRFGHIDRYDDFLALMLSDLQVRKNAGESLPENIPFEQNLKLLDGQRLEIGRTYTQDDLSLDFNFERFLSYADAFAPLGVQELEYIGQKPCNAADENASCAHLEFRVKERDPTEPTYNTSVLQLSINMLLEPQTLLLHDIDYVSEATIYIDNEKTEVRSVARNHVQVQYQYENSTD